MSGQLFDLNEKEEFLDTDSFPAEAANSSVSGVGIKTDDEAADAENAKRLEELLSSINSPAEKQMADDLKKQEEEREQYRLNEEKRFSEATEKYNKDRYEKEQIAKAERERLEAEEKQRIEEAKRNKKNNSLIGRVKNFAVNVIGESKKKVTDVATKINDAEIVIPVLSKDDEDTDKKTVSVPDTAKEEEIKTPEPEITSSIEDALDEDMLSSEEITPETPPQVNSEEVKEDAPEKKKPGLNLFAKKSKEPKEPKAAEPKDEPSVSSSDEPNWKYIATHDEMTGLLNTRAYAEALKTMPGNLGVVFFDINNLKYVNDNFSHEAGNRLIRGVSNSLRKHFGESYLYRTGGDEFICLIPKTSRKTVDEISEHMNNVHEDMKELTKNDPEKIVYAVSIGYAIGDNNHPVEEIVKAADTAMYKNKKAYKEAHPQYAARPEDLPAKTDNLIPEQPFNYEDGLTKEQNELRKKVADKHSQVNGSATKNIVKEIQRRADEVRGILIASPTFDHLFIITDIDAFVDLILSENALIDYSYFYVVYEGGPQYYGADEYYNEVTHIFEDIAEALISGKYRSEKEIRAIKGINIFKNIYI